MLKTDLNPHDVRVLYSFPEPPKPIHHPLNLSVLFMVIVFKTNF